MQRGWMLVIAIKIAIITILSRLSFNPRCKPYNALTYSLLYWTLTQNVIESIVGVDSSLKSADYYRTPASADDCQEAQARLKNTSLRSTAKPMNLAVESLLTPDGNYFLISGNFYVAAVASLIYSFARVKVRIHQHVQK